MPHSTHHPHPPTKQLRRLWNVTQLGCICFGLALAAMNSPVQDAVTPLLRYGFGAVLALSIVVLALAIWRLMRLYKSVAAPTASPVLWLVLVVSFSAGVMLQLWWMTSPVSEASALTGLGVTLLVALGLAEAAAASIYSVVKLIVSSSRNTRQHQEQAGR